MFPGIARNTIFLHDVFVKKLNELLDPKRCKKSPHPFYIDDKAQREDLIEFMRGLYTDSLYTNSTKVKADKKMAKSKKIVQVVSYLQQHSYYFIS